VRRIAFLLAVLVAGAASAAPAQGSAFLSAQLYPDSLAGPDVSFHVGSLLDDPEWRDALDHNLPIRLHWKVQTFRERPVIDESGPTVELDVRVERDPMLQAYLYQFTAPGESPTRSLFNSLDSLRLEVGQAWRVQVRNGLKPGRWYYTVSLEITTLTDADLTAVQRNQSRSGGDQGGGIWAYLQRKLIGGVVPRRVLPTERTRTFTVR
jgi:hypothetical protein